MSYHYGFLVETLVSILLLLTILYCVRLSRQLRLLKADEQSLRATISELITATEFLSKFIKEQIGEKMTPDQARRQTWTALCQALFASAEFRFLN